MHLLCNLPWHGTGIRETFAFSLEIGALALSTFDAESWFGREIHKNIAHDELAFSVWDQTLLLF